MEESGQPVPDRLYEPVLDAGDMIFWKAYEDLATCRTPTLSGLGQIPWTAIHVYSIEQGFDDLEELSSIIWSVDEHLRMRLMAQAKAEAAAAKARGKAK